MTAKTEPVSGLSYGWALGENYWKDGMDANLTKIGAILQLSVTDYTLTTPPTPTGTGECYIIPTGATGAWTGKTNQVAVDIESNWVYFTPKAGWIASTLNDSSVRTFTGTAWVDLFDFGSL